MSLVPLAYVRLCVAYDPRTGIFTGLDRPREHFLTEWDWLDWPRGQLRARRRRLDGHHEDYSKPLSVHLLCQRCHQEHHNAVRLCLRIASGDLCPSASSALPSACVTGVGARRR